MKKGLSKLFAIMIVTAIVLGSTPMVMLAKAAPPSRGFWIVPETETFYTNTTSVGTRFNVTIWVATTASDSYSWQAGLYYDGSLLNNTGVWMSAPLNDMSNWFKSNGVTSLSMEDSALQQDKTWV